MTDETELHLIKAVAEAAMLYWTCHPASENSRREFDCEEAAKALRAHRDAKAKPAECRPPAKHEGELWHWLRSGPSEDLFVACWHYFPRGGFWSVTRSDRETSAQEAALLGWTWQSVARPSEPKPEPVEFDERREAEAALASWSEPPLISADAKPGYIAGWIDRARKGFEPTTTAQPTCKPSLQVRGQPDGLPDDAEGCPACGALPCDWVNDPTIEEKLIVAAAQPTEPAVIRRIPMEEIYALAKWPAAPVAKDWTDGEIVKLWCAVSGDYTVSPVTMQFARALLAGKP